MTQLDRLKALLEIWEHPGEQGYGIGHMIDALPDLIRIARAAKKYSDYGRGTYLEELDMALAPLYREVES